MSAETTSFLKSGNQCSQPAKQGSDSGIKSHQPILPISVPVSSTSQQSQQVSSTSQQVFVPSTLQQVPVPSYSDDSARHKNIYNILQLYCKITGETINDIDAVCDKICNVDEQNVHCFGFTKDKKPCQTNREFLLSIQGCNEHYCRKHAPAEFLQKHDSAKQHKTATKSANIHCNAFTKDNTPCKAFCGSEITSIVYGGKEIEVHLCSSHIRQKPENLKINLTLTSN